VKVSFKLDGHRLGRGAGMGALVASVVFAADLAATFAAIGFLFDASLGGFLLLGLAGAGWLLLASAVFALGALLVPGRVWSRLKWRHVILGALVVAMVLGVQGYRSRAQRQHTPAPPTSIAPAPGAKAVLLIVADALRADTLYGSADPRVPPTYPLAPALGALVAQSPSVVFTDAEACAGWTLPSVATLLTGLHNTPLDASSGVLPAWAPTAGEHFRAAGFATAAVVDNLIVEPRAGFARGFDRFFQKSSYRFAFSLFAFRLLPRLVQNLSREWSRAFYLGHAGLTDAAIKTIDSAPTDRPLFLYVHYMDPHAPYLFHPEFGPDPPQSTPIEYHTRRDALVNHTVPPPTAAELAWLWHRYNGELYVLAPSVARLITHFRERFNGEAVVVLTADHGEEFGDHGRIGHGVTLQRELVRVPLIVTLPRSLASRVDTAAPITTPVSHLDLLPTVLELAGVTPRPQPVAMQGQSWWPWLQGQAAAPTGQDLVASQSRNGRRVYRLRRDNQVYIKEMFYNGRPTAHALYDLALDPTEQHNLLAQPHDTPQGGLAARLDAAYAALMAARPKDAPEAEEADLESLRAIGYVH
jgi:arylsulfatase A-like enzyme